MKIRRSWKSITGVNPTHHFYCLILLLIASSPPNVSCDGTKEGTATAKTSDEVIKDREPLYESAINFQAVEVDPKEVAHLRSFSNSDENDGHQRQAGTRTVRAYPKYVPEANDGRGQEKNYAFAYAVRDGEGGDDFSHKERREGRVTVGEYSVLLPDGRTQVVRYTADGKEGFKADVTYEGEPNPGSYAKPAAPTPAAYQSSGSINSIRTQAPGATYVVNYQRDDEPYRKSYRPVPLNRAGPSSPSPTPQGPVYFSYPLKARRPSTPPSVLYDSRAAQRIGSTPAPIVYGSGSAAAPSTVYLASGSNKQHRSSQQQQYATSPTPATFKYYPSPSPNSFYEQDRKYVTRTPKFIVISRKPPTTPPPPPPADLGSPYKPIMRGQRAGPDPKRSLKPVSSQSVRPPVSAYIVQRVNPTETPQYSHVEDYVDQQNNGGLLPVQYFKAGPGHSSVSRTGPLLQEQSVKQVYTSSGGLSTPAPPHISYSPTPIPYVDNNLGSLDYSRENPNYVVNEQPKVDISPVKSSVATYTTEYLGGTPSPSLFQVTSSPGFAVGRPVHPSVSGLSYITGPRPTPRQLGIKKVLSRLPTTSPPPRSLATKTYELGRPDFGSSVSYSSSDSFDREAPRYTKVAHSSNQLPPLHTGVLNEYSVERKLGTVSGYEQELI